MPEFEVTFDQTYETTNRYAVTVEAGSKEEAEEAAFTDRYIGHERLVNEDIGLYSDDEWQIVSVEETEQSKRESIGLGGIPINHPTLFT